MCLFFLICRAVIDMLDPVFPPKKSNGPDRQVRQQKQVHDAAVQAQAAGTAIFQVGFSGHFAHRALRRKTDGDQQKAENKYFFHKNEDLTAKNRI